MKLTNLIVCRLLIVTVVFTCLSACASKVSVADISKFQEQNCYNTLDEKGSAFTVKLLDSDQSIGAVFDSSFSSNAQDSSLSTSVSYENNYNRILEIFDNRGYRLRSIRDDQAEVNIEIKYGVDTQLKVAGMHTLINVSSAASSTTCTDEIDVIKVVSADYDTELVTQGSESLNYNYSSMLVELAKVTSNVLDIYFSRRKFEYNPNVDQTVALKRVSTFDDRAFKWMDAISDTKHTFAYTQRDLQKSVSPSGQHVFILFTDELDKLVSLSKLEYIKRPKQNELAKFSREQQYRNDLIRYNRIRRLK